MKDRGLRLFVFAFVGISYKIDFGYIQAKVKGVTSVVQLVVSVILYFVMFFGVAFILNMLLRRTWLMTILYPFVAIIIIDGIPFFDYFTNTSEAFSALGNTLGKLTIADYVIMGAGLLGTIVSGFVIKILRKSGYRMF